MNIVSNDNISLILQAGESNTVEFKTRVSGSPNSLPKIISAFASWHQLPTSLMHYALALPESADH